MALISREKTGSASFVSLALAGISVVSTASLVFAAGCTPSDEGPGRKNAAATGIPVENASTTAAVTGDDNAGDTSAGAEGDDPALPAPATAAANLPKNTPDALVAETDRELHVMRESAYEHHTTIDESTGRFDFDCSGFAGYALESADPVAWGELRGATKSRPLAKDFEGFFASIAPGTTRGHWSRVARVADLRPGDVISWLQPSDSSSKNTGHVLIVHAALRPVEAEPGTFYVPIVDSTASKHGAKDSRADRDTSGLGTGTILLMTDASGAPTAFRWSSGKKSRVRTTAIAFGRIVP